MASDTNTRLGRHACALGWAMILSFGFSVVFALMHHGLLPALTRSLQAAGIGLGPLGRLDAVLAVASPAVPALAATAGLVLAYLRRLPGTGSTAIDDRTPTASRLTSTVGWLVLAFYASGFAGSLVFAVAGLAVIPTLYAFDVSLPEGLGGLPVAASLVAFVLVPCVTLAFVLMQGIRGRLPGTKKGTGDSQATQVEAPPSRR